MSSLLSPSPHPLQRNSAPEYLPVYTQLRAFPSIPFWNVLPLDHCKAGSTDTASERPLLATQPGLHLPLHCSFLQYLSQSTVIILACLFACLPLENVSSTARAPHPPVHHHVQHLPKQRCQAHSQHSLLKMNEFVRTPFKGKVTRLNTKLKLWFYFLDSFSGNALFSLSLIIPSFALISLAALTLAPGNAGCYKAQSSSFLTWRKRKQNNLVRRSRVTDRGAWMLRFQMKFMQMLQLTEVFYASSNENDWLGLTYPLLANWNFALHSYIMQRQSSWAHSHQNLKLGFKGTILHFKEAACNTNLSGNKRYLFLRLEFLDPEMQS